MPQVKRLGVAGSKAWRRRSVFLPGTCDTNQSYVPSSVAGPPSFFRPATINNQTCDICQRDFLANLLPSVEDGRCGRGLRGGWAGKVSFQRRHLARGQPFEGRRSQISGQGPRRIIRPCPARPLIWARNAQKPVKCVRSYDLPDHLIPQSLSLTLPSTLSSILSSRAGKKSKPVRASSSSTLIEQSLR